MLPMSIRAVQWPKQAHVSPIQYAALLLPVLLGPQSLRRNATLSQVKDLILQGRGSQRNSNKMKQQQQQGTDNAADTLHKPADAAMFTPLRMLTSLCCCPIVHSEHLAGGMYSFD
jgi:hypothetical protein